MIGLSEYKNPREFSYYFTINPGWYSISFYPPEVEQEVHGLNFSTYPATRG
jgi:hypothetical protein